MNWRKSTTVSYYDTDLYLSDDDYLYDYYDSDLDNYDMDDFDRYGGYIDPVDFYYPDDWW